VQTMSYKMPQSPVECTNDAHLVHIIHEDENATLNDLIILPYSASVDKGVARMVPKPAGSLVPMIFVLDTSIFGVGVLLAPRLVNGIPTLLVQVVVALFEVGGVPMGGIGLGCRTGEA
jgi:hypothetical protein